MFTIFTQQNLQLDVKALLCTLCMHGPLDVMSLVHEGAVYVTSFRSMLNPQMSFDGTNVPEPVVHRDYPYETRSREHDGQVGIA